MGGKSGDNAAVCCFSLLLCLSLSGYFFPLIVSLPASIHLLPHSLPPLPFLPFYSPLKTHKLPFPLSHLFFTPLPPFSFPPFYLCLITSVLLLLPHSVSLINQFVHPSLSAQSLSIPSCFPIPSFLCPLFSSFSTSSSSHSFLYLPLSLPPSSFDCHPLPSLPFLLSYLPPCLPFTLQPLPLFSILLLFSLVSTPFHDFFLPDIVLPPLFFFFPSYPALSLATFYLFMSSTSLPENTSSPPIHLLQHPSLFIREKDGVMQGSLQSNSDTPHQLWRQSEQEALKDKQWERDMET